MKFTKDLIKIQQRGVELLEQIQMFEERIKQYLENESKMSKLFGTEYISKRTEHNTTICKMCIERLFQRYEKNQTIIEMK